MEIQQRAPLPSSRTFPPFSMFFSRSRRSTVTTLTSCFKRIAWNYIYIYIRNSISLSRIYSREIQNLLLYRIIDRGNLARMWLFFMISKWSKICFSFFFFCRIMNRGNNFPWFGVNVAFFFCLWFWNIYSFVDYR